MIAVARPTAMAKAEIRCGHPRAREPHREHRFQNPSVPKHGWLIPSLPLLV